MHIKNAIEQIEKIDWIKINIEKSFDNDEYNKNNTLLQEYLRRFATFINRQKFDNDFMKIVKNTDFILLMGAIMNNDGIDYATLEKKYQYIFNEIPNNHYTKYIIMFYLKISEMLDDNMNIFEEQDFYIYDPLLKILSNGGGFSRDKREFVLINGAYFIFNGWYDRALKSEETDIKQINF